MQGQRNPKEALRKIKQEMVFPADMLRESYQTIEVRNILNDSLNEEEKSDDMSIFDEINILDCEKTIRARSELTGSEYTFNMASVASGLELDQTMQLSIEHCINFDLRDNNAILNQLSEREGAAAINSSPDAQ